MFLGRHTDLSSLNRLIRGKAGEFVNFALRQTAIALKERFVHGKWESEMDFVVHGIRDDRLCVIIITDDKFSAKSAERVLNKAIMDVMTALPKGWESTQEDCNKVKLEAEYMMIKNDEGSSLEQLQKELDETKGMVMDNIQQMMERQGKLEDIMKDSEDLSVSAQIFAKDAKKLKRCRCFGM